MPPPPPAAPAPPPSEPPDGGAAGRGPLVAFFFRLGVVAADSLAWIRDGLARAIIRARIPPNAVTLTGPLALLLVFWPLWQGDQWTAGWVVLLGGAFDSLDGAVARISGGETRFGAYLDSVVDRYADMLLLFGLLVWVLLHLEGAAQSRYLALWCLAVLGTVATSYARARAEILIPHCAVGFMERPERTVSVILGLVCGNAHAALIVLAVFTNLIAIQRIYFARAVMERGTAPSGAFRYWTYRRGSAEHTMHAVAIILFLCFGHLLVAPPV